MYDETKLIIPPYETTTALNYLLNKIIKKHTGAFGSYYLQEKVTEYDFFTFLGKKVKKFIEDGGLNKPRTYESYESSCNKSSSRPTEKKQPSASGRVSPSVSSRPSSNASASSRPSSKSSVKSPQTYIIPKDVTVTRK